MAEQGQNILTSPKYEQLMMSEDYQMYKLRVSTHALE